MRLLIAIGCLCALTACRSPVPPQAAPPNVLLVTVDTLRADRLGVGITPALDRLAARSVQFTNARTVAPLTLPAHASIMTGQLPPAHGVRVNGVPLGDRHATLAMRLQRAGYRTGAVVGAFVLDRRFGLARGFDEYDDDIRRDPAALERLSAERAGNVVVDRAMAWIDRGDQRPWFLWAHLYDPHAPYNAPGALDVKDDVITAYNREVAYADAQIGRLLAHLDARADRARTAIVIAGDHGESLGEHGEATHGMLLFEPAVRVPMFMSWPGVAPRAQSEPVSIVDIGPTILAAVTHAADATLAGRDILANVDAEREVYVETEYPPAAGWSAAQALVQGRFKLLNSGANSSLRGTARLFDLAIDPAEKTNLHAARAQLVAGMQKRIAALRASVPDSTTEAIDPEVAARLRALGYVSTSPQPSDGSALPDAADHIDQWVAFESALATEERGAIDEALAQMRLLATAAPDSPLFQSTYARLLSATGRHQQALERYRAIVQRWPRDPSLFHELAVAARTAGAADEAVRAEQASLTLAPGAPSVHNGLGLALADLQRHEEAARAFAAAAQADPTNASYAANLGNAYRALNRLDEAAAAYRQALQRDPRLADASNGLGVVLVQQQRAADAVPLFERAIAEDSAFLEPQLNLGIALQQSGQRQRAIDQYRRVERVAPVASRERQAAKSLREQLERR